MSDIRRLSDPDTIVFDHDVKPSNLNDKDYHECLDYVSTKEQLYVCISKKLDYKVDVL